MNQNKKVKFIPLPRPNQETQDTVQCCIWDTEPLPPDKKPLSAPMKKINGVIHFTGQFCSFACIKAYINDKIGIQNPIPLYLLLEYARSYGIIENFNPAPPRETLKKFGGYMSIEEFRSKSITHFCTLKEPPFQFYDIRAEEESRLINDFEPEKQSTLTVEQFREKLQKNSAEFFAKQKKTKGRLNQNSIEAIARGMKREKKTKSEPINSAFSILIPPSERK